ncbi:hypothetical protein ACFFP0_25575 [Rhizobium puerariae]|uniref:Uncharacterized protein n=1 Tax=Rhizobium puerariae TaxID=1585791 RepID=A0ABV6ANV4_9HYPH
MFKIALVGGFGGVAPSLVDKAQAFASGEIERWLVSAPNPLISVLCASVAVAVYFGIGAAIAVIYKEQELQKALLLGIGAPALIMAATQGDAQAPKPIEVGWGLIGSLVGTAYAQGVTNELPGQFELKVDSSWSKGECPTCGVTFLGRDGKVLSAQPLSPEEQTTAIAVPKEAATIVLSGANTNAASIDVKDLEVGAAPKSGPVTLGVDVNRSYWNDLTRSFGARSVKPYDFRVQIER